MDHRSGDILDGGAEPHYLTGDAGDRAGSLDADDIRHMHAAKMARTREEMSSGLRERNADGSSSRTY